MQENAKENSARNLIRTFGIGGELQFPACRRHYIRSLAQEAQIDFDYKFRTRIDRESKMIIVNRIK